MFHRFSLLALVLVIAISVSLTGEPVRIAIITEGKTLFRQLVFRISIRLSH